MKDFFFNKEGCDCNSTAISIPSRDKVMLNMRRNQNTAIYCWCI